MSDTFPDFGLDSSAGGGLIGSTTEGGGLEAGGGGDPPPPPPPPEPAPEPPPVKKFSLAQLPRGHYRVQWTGGAPNVVFDTPHRFAGTPFVNKQPLLIDHRVPEVITVTGAYTAITFTRLGPDDAKPKYQNKIGYGSHDVKYWTFKAAQVMGGSPADVPDAPAWRLSTDDIASGGSSGTIRGAWQSMGSKWRKLRNETPYVRNTGPAQVNALLPAAAGDEFGVMVRVLAGSPSAPWKYIATFVIEQTGNFWGWDAAEVYVDNRVNGEQQQDNPLPTLDDTPAEGEPPAGELEELPDATEEVTDETEVAA